MSTPRLRILLLTAVSIALAAFAPSLSAQLPSEKSAAPRLLSFDVASIKSIEPGGRPTHGWVGFRYRPDGMEAAYISLPMLMRYAYGYSRFRLESQVAGAPDWATSQRYDIEARMSSSNIALFQKLGKVEQEQWREEMLQSLLAERFHLTLHRGTKQVPVYELVVAKGGIQFKPAAEDEKRRMIEFPQDKATVFPKDSMEGIASFLTDQAHAELDRPIVDRTGLTGIYTLTLNRWSPMISSKVAHSTAKISQDTAKIPQDTIGDDMVPLSVALEEQGLHLQPSTAAVEVLIVDHVEKPSEN